MPEDDPLYIRILDKLGVNTTRLKWKLYEKEKKLKDMAKHRVKPTRFEWLSYPHKICLKCRAVNDKEASICHSCDAKLPSMLGYRIRRILTGSASDDSPVVTQIFLGLMLFFFAIQISVGGFSLGNIMNPSFLGTIRLGSFCDAIFIGPSEWYRWTAFALLHGGLIHIGFNGYALYNIGPLIENYIGRSKMLTLITITQLGSALTSYIVYFKVQEVMYTQVVGASGWIFGIIGFAIVRFHFHGGLTHHIRNSLLKWSGFCLIFGFMVPGISNTAHIGGMIAGALLALLPPGGDLRKPWIDKLWDGMAVLSILIWLVTVVWMLYALFFGDSEYYVIEELLDNGYYD